MKLFFDKKTRRMMGSIEGSNKGFPTNLITITGTMPAAPETSHLNADNVTVITKALTGTELAARAVKPNGKPAPAAKPTVADRATTYNTIDTAAGDARLRHSSQGAMQQQLYDIKAAESVAYIAAGYPKVSASYPLITAQAAGAGATVKSVADKIIASRKAWLVVIGKIEALRLQAKSTIKTAKTIASINKTEADVIALLLAI